MYYSREPPPPPPPVVVVVIFLSLFWPKRIPLSLPLFAGVVRLMQACTSYHIASWDFSWCRNTCWVWGRVPKTLTFKMRLGAQPFLWKWVLFVWEWKMISISKSEHQPSFWNRGPGELGNGLFIGTCDFVFTVEPNPLKATSLQRSLFFVPADKKSIHWLLFKTSLQRPLSSVPWPIFYFFKKNKKKYIFFKQRLPLKVKKKWKIKIIKLSKQKLLPYREQYWKKKKDTLPSVYTFQTSPNYGGLGVGWSQCFECHMTMSFSRIFPGFRCTNVLVRSHSVFELDRRMPSNQSDNVGLWKPSKARYEFRTNSERQGKTSSGFCMGYLQANLAILPSSLAKDFQRFCELNNAPCPLLYRSKTGELSAGFLAPDSDVRYSESSQP